MDNVIIAKAKAKVALCFIISYEHRLNQEALWKKWIEPNKDWINVYVHYKHLHLIKSSWLRSCAIPPRYIATSSYLHVVPAYISVLSFSMHHDSDNKWFCVLTDSCMPLITPDEFKSRFYQYGDKSIMRHDSAEWNVLYHSRANLKYLPKSMHVMHDPWFTLTRTHVQKIINFILHKETRKIYKMVCAGGLANESIFAIMLGLYNDSHSYNTKSILKMDELTNPNNPNVLNTSATIADWSRRDGPMSPHTFSASDNPHLNRQIIQKLKERNPLAMFLRKTSPDFSFQSTI